MDIAPGMTPPLPRHGAPVVETLARARDLFDDAAVHLRIAPPRPAGGDTTPSDAVISPELGARITAARGVELLDAVLPGLDALAPGAASALQAARADAAAGIAALDDAMHGREPVPARDGAAPRFDAASMWTGVAIGLLDAGEPRPTFPRVPLPEPFVQPVEHLA